MVITASKLFASGEESKPPSWQMYLDGGWTDMPCHIEVTSPFTGATIGTIPSATHVEAAQAVRSAERGLREMRGLSTGERADILRRTADRISRDSEVLARQIVDEGGKTIREARREVFRCTNTLRLSAEEATRAHGEVIPFDSMAAGRDKIGYWRRDPVGVVVAITPYNDPLNLVAHKLGPALAMGNAVVLKPSEKAPFSALTLAKILLEEGLPPNALNVVTGYGADVGAGLFQQDAVRLVSFTGGRETGRLIAQQTGIARLSLEMGGFGTVIVAADADIGAAARACVSGAFSAAGQNCISVQRILVHRSVRQDFIEQFMTLTEAMHVGDPHDEMTDMGPMIDEATAASVGKHVDEAVAMGAQVLVGNKREGALHWPTVLAGVPDQAWLATNEAFAPVVLIDSYESEEKAFAIANRVDFAIHAAIYTADLNLAMRAYQELEASTVLVNESTDFRVDAMPFGGIKGGGLGREGVAFAAREMSEPKSLCINLAAGR